jgi:hypothetical protein
MNGTSMATAAASGVVALMLENDPSLTPDQVKFILSYTGQQFVNQYGEVLDSIFHQGAGRIWSPAAVYGDYPPEGHANVGMDIVADYTHGWETEQELGYHYEGPVKKLLSDDGGVYLYYMEGVDGSLMALGAADKVKTLFQTADDLDELADQQPSGQMVWAGGEIIWADGQMAWTGGPIVWVGGQRAPDGTEKTWSGGQMVWAGGQMVWAGGQMVWAGRPNIGYGISTSPEPGPIVETPVPNDWQWLEAELVWSGDQINWVGGEMVWEPGQVFWDGGTLDPNFTFSYADHWVNDDGTVEEIVEYSVVFVPLFLK